MKPIGLNSKDFGCCPGHDKVPFNTKEETNRGRRTRKIDRKKKMTRYWKRSEKNKNIQSETI